MAHAAYDCLEGGAAALFRDEVHLVDEQQRERLDQVVAGVGGPCDAVEAGAA